MSWCECATGHRFKKALPYSIGRPIDFAQLQAVPSDSRTLGTLLSIDPATLNQAAWGSLVQVIEPSVGRGAEMGLIELRTADLVGALHRRN